MTCANCDHNLYIYCVYLSTEHYRSMICTFQIQYQKDNVVCLVPYFFERTQYTKFSEDSSKLSEEEHPVNHQILKVLNLGIMLHPPP